MQLPRTVDPSGDFRMNAWIRLDSVDTADQVLAAQSSIPWLYVPAGGTSIATGLGGTSLLGSQPLPLHAWVLVILVHSRDQLRLYLGGHLAASATVTVPASTATMLLGNTSTPTRTGWHGGIAYVDMRDYAG